MIDCEFTNQSLKIVERFLQSAVVVDDWSFTDESSEPEPPKDFKSPPKRPTIDSAPPTEELPSVQAPEATDDNEGIQRFNPKKVIDAFANKGIVCAVLDPKQEELDSLYSTITKLAAISDVLIFDWSLVGDAGLHTREFIKNLVHNDEDNKDRLRLIVIYTIESKISDILDDVEREINKLPEAPSISKNQAEYSLHIGSTRIVILLKQDAKIPPENKELLARKIPFDELANRVIYEFTEMTYGLIPNVALQSMSEIRKNTSKILKYFNSELDVPYLAHRALLEDPADAEEHIVELISADLSAILEEANVKQHVNIDRLIEWLNLREVARQEFPFTKKNGSVSQLTKEQVITMLRDGISKTELGLTGKNKDRQEKNPQEIMLSQLFSGNPTAGTEAEEVFAHMTVFRTFFGAHTPTLTLGTVMKDEESDYLVCIQPRCDCVRLDGATCFLFLPVEVNPGGSVFDLVIKDNGNYVRTKITKKVASVKQITFTGDANRMITAEMDAGNYYFIAEPQNAAQPPKRYKWIGELRLERAISLSNVFSAELTRVGFTESEWLRLYAKKR